MCAAQGKMSASIHAHRLSLAGVDCKGGSDNENGVELQFASSRQPSGSAPIRLEDLPLPDVLVGPKPPAKEAISDAQMSTG